MHDVELRHATVTSSVNRTATGSFGITVGPANHVGGVQPAISAHRSSIHEKVLAVSMGTVIVAVASAVTA